MRPGLIPGNTFIWVSIKYAYFKEILIFRDLISELPGLIFTGRIPVVTAKKNLKIGYYINKTHE